MFEKSLALLALFAPTLSLAAQSGETGRCALQLVDDQGIALNEEVEVCRDMESGTPADCFDVMPSAVRPEVETSRLRIEGEGHGPAVAVPEKADNGICTISVPRKAVVAVSFNPEETRFLEASFYRPDQEPDLYRFAHRISFEAETEHQRTILIPAGVYVLSMTERGWAPDLRLLEATPGSSHDFRFRQKDGWSAVLRAVTDHDETPVPDAEFEVRTLVGFDEPDRIHLGEPAEVRTLSKRKTDAHGLAVVSGLRVPAAAAVARHDQFLDAEIPAFSSDVGTFRVFDARLSLGGSLAVHVLREGAPALDARCGLSPPEREADPPWNLQAALYEIEADDQGVCRAVGIQAGVYALKITLPDSPDAFAIEPIAVHDGQLSKTTVELRPILVGGQVMQGEKGVSGYKVKFERADAFEIAAPYYPAGHATTDEDGEYQMTLWTPGRYLGQVSTASTTVGNFQMVDLDHDETVNFRLAVAELEGQVVDDSGDPRPEARLTVKAPNMSRGAVLDEDARFQISFPDESGHVELQAAAPGFHPSESVELMLDKDQKTESVTLVLRRRKTREGRVFLPSGHPAVGVAVSAHPFGLRRSAYPLERTASDEAGRFVVPLESEPLRIFYGGPGCALGSLDLDGFDSSDVASQPLDFEIRCEPPSHILLQLVTDDPELRIGASILLRRGDVLIPPSVLERHLLSLGLPAVTNGQGRIGLVALASGDYDLYHGTGTSYIDLENGQHAAGLTSVSLGSGSVIETSVALDFQQEKSDWLPFSVN